EELGIAGVPFAEHGQFYFEDKNCRVWGALFSCVSHGPFALQDDVLMYVMLWRIDAGDYAGALEIGRHALRHGWVMPLGNRNVQTVLAEEMADAAQSAMLAATGFDAALLLQTLELTDGLDMPDQSRARLHKAIGAVLSESNPASALNHLNHALQLDPRCGVKKDKQQLERRLRNDSR
ncbi:phage terminase small subunit, partial [Escherichia coli]|uniref:phage terminase small subunit n=1 Tax=Escherichia coli TaxID=562 RepID=UPI003EE2039E